MTGPSALSAGGTRVVLPAPGAAVTTAARARRTSRTMASTYGSIGSDAISGDGLRSGSRADSDRTGHARSAEPAITVRVLREVLLVVLLGVVELRRGRELGGDRTVTGGGQLRLIRIA